VIPDLVKGADHIADLVVVAQQLAVMERDHLGVGTHEHIRICALLSELEDACCVAMADEARSWSLMGAVSMNSTAGSLRWYG
jgi:hypothetical protein